MDDDELMRRVAAATPAIAQRTNTVREAIDEVMADARPSRRRRRRALIAGASLSVVLLGGASVAVADPALLDWLRFTPDRTIQHVNADGDLCTAGMIVRPEGVSTEDPSFLAAREILLSIDFDTIKATGSAQDGDALAAAAKAKSFEEWNTAHPDATMQPAPDDPETGRVLQSVYQLITDGLKARGLDPSHVSLESGGSCDQATQ